MSKLLTDKMKKCHHDPKDRWTDGTCMNCGWNMWENYVETQEELELCIHKEELRRLGNKDLVEKYLDLEAQLAEAEKENKKLNNIIEMLCPKAHTPVKE